MRSRTSVASGLMLASALVFGAFEAAQARGVFRQADCPEQGNWCATSRGGLQNCNICCGTPGGGSFCAFEDEDSGPPPLPQGCVCG